MARGKYDMRYDSERDGQSTEQAPERWRQRILLPMIVLGAVALLAVWLLQRTGLGTVKAKSAEELRNIRISEVQSNNALTLQNGGYSWIELENTGDAPVSLRGLCLTRDDRVNKTLVFPDILLEPRGFLLIHADGSTLAGAGEALHAPFRLSKSGEYRLYLYDAAQTLLDSVTVPPMQRDESYCRNAQGEWVVTVDPTPGRSNNIAQTRGEALQAGDVALNELMSSNTTLFPDETGATHDYIELINHSDHEVDLEGYWLSDSAAKLNKWQFPSVHLPAGGVLAVHCSGEDRRDDPAHLHASFRLSKGETVYLSRPDGVTVSVVTLPELLTGQAYSWVEGERWVSTLPPTPNRENTPEAAMRLDGERRGERAGGVYISEVMALPVTEKSDWLELYNDGDSDVDLSGWGLSDRLSHPRRWQFPSGTVIPAHGFQAVFLVAREGTASGSYLSAPFALSGEGDALCLCDPSGNIRDSLFLPQQYSGISFGRSPGGDCGYLAAPTPLAANGASALLGPAQGARYSVSGGLYSTGDRFEVTLSANPGARIYYTLDCSDPGEGKTLYDGTPIPVSATTILRTRVYEDGYLPSIMDTQSYLFDVQAATEAPYVISLVSDPTGLFSDETGIMVKGLNAFAKFPYGDYNKGANFWMDWEREAHVEMFTGSGETAISQECGIKLHGRNTRAYELKSFKVMAKGQYGSNRFQYPIFRDRPYDEYEAFILRYSGQDYKYAFMRDVVMTNLAANTSVMYMEAMESIVYLNGEYYSAMYVRENISPFSLARREGWAGQERALDLVKSGYQVKQGSNDSYLALKAFLESHDNNSQEVYDRIAAEVDIDNFIEYATMYIVFSPPDTVNVKRYRNTQADGKWRWVIYDLDRGLRGGFNDSEGGFALMAQGTNAQLFRAFMNNDILRERFLTYLNTALSTYLSSQSMADAALEQLERIRPLLPQYLGKVGVSQSKYTGSLKSFRSCIGKRPTQILAQCAKFLNLSQEEMDARFADAYAAIAAYNH